MADYTSAIIELQNTQDLSWQQKQLIARKLIDAMWKDPSLEYGDTKRLLEARMLGLAGIQDTRELGPGYDAALNGILTGEIKSIKQILEMENSHALTNKGADELIERFTSLRDKPAQ